MRSGLIFSRSGGPSRLWKVSPLLFSQYEDINGLFLPDDHELPQHGLSLSFLVFDFGFSDPMLTIAAQDMGIFPVTPSANFLATAITGVSDVPPSTGVVPSAGALVDVQQTPAYLINFQQTHNGTTRQWASKAISNNEAVGSGENPLLFKSPVLILAGDTIACTVQNLANTPLRAQIVLQGGSL